MKQLLIKKTIFVLGVVVALIFLTILFLFVSSLKKPPKTKSLDSQKFPKNINTSLVKTVLPDTSSPLAPGAIQTFTITLDTAIDPSLVKATLTASSPSKDDKKEDVELISSHTYNKLTLTTAKPILPFTLYTLKLTLRGQTILQKSYFSKVLSPTPLPTNNPTLSSYLPHETLIYLLEFDPKQNIYLMHFKYDPYSPSSLTEQFEKAKRSANEFIESKGIDLKTVNIQYLYK